MLPGLPGAFEAGHYSPLMTLRAVIIVALLCASVGGVDAQAPLVSAATSGAVALSDTGGTHTCGIHADGTLSCWGSNLFRQAAPPEGTFTYAAAGDRYTCAIRDGGELLCWGLNELGQADAPSGSFTQVTAGTNSSCGLRTNGSIVCWGDSPNGETAAAAGDDFVAISGSHDHACALRDDGTMTCWGSSAGGATIPPAGTFLQVSAGRNRTCVIRVDATLVCWGDESEVAVSNVPAGKFVDIAVYESAACAVRDDGLLTCWGSNRSGLLDAPSGQFVDVIVGADNACAIDTTGGVQCWGSGLGAAGPPRTGYESVEVSRYGSGMCLLRPDGHRDCSGSALSDWIEPATIVELETGYLQTCVVLTDGELRCFGGGLFGLDQIPDGSFSAVELSPFFGCALTTGGSILCWGELAPTPPTGTFSSIHVGDAAICAMTSTGAAVCANAPQEFESDPDLPPAPGGSFDLLAIGSVNACGLRSSGSIECWGDPASAVTSPIGEFRSLRAAGDRFCAIETATDGIVCWASDPDPFLVQEAPDGRFDDISIGANGGCGIRLDGVLQCWGFTVVLGEPFTPTPLRPWPGLRAQPPVRIFDTRGHDPDAPFAQPHPGTAGNVIGLNLQGSVPPDATAVAVTVTVVSPTGPGFVTVWPCDQPKPLASSVNYLTGQIVANTVVVGVAPTSALICLEASASTDLLVDVVGYVPSGGTLVDVVAARLADTRPGESTVDGIAAGVGRVPAGGVLEIETWGRGGVPEGAAGVVVNVVAAEPDAPGFLTIFPCGGAVPLASNVNYTQPFTTNMAFTPTGVDGKICVFSSATSDVVVDVNAFVPENSPPVGFGPFRFADTRLGELTVDGAAAGTGRQPAGTTLEVDVTGRAGVPDDATSVMLNVAVVAPDAPGFLTVYPCGAQVPLASALNYAPGDVRAVAVPVKVGLDGRVCIFTLAATDLVVDLNGYEAGG